MESILTDSDTYHEVHDKGVVQPIYLSEDSNGNIEFDIDSIRDEFEKLIYLLEQHNEQSEFDWDNML